MSDLVGDLIGTAEGRAAWRALVSALHQAAATGGPLDGWAFHGTSGSNADGIAVEGVAASYAIAADDGRGPWVECSATHWGTPKVAAFYAEDLIESSGDPDMALAIVAAPLAFLEREGVFAVDGQTLDAPLFSRLGEDEDEIWRRWNASAQDWAACWSCFGTVLVLSPVGPEDLVVLRSESDVHELASRIASRAPTA